MATRRALLSLIAVSLTVLAIAAGLLWLRLAELREANEETAESAESPIAELATALGVEMSPYSLMSTFVLPGEQVEVEAVLTDHRPGSKPRSR